MSKHKNPTRVLTEDEFFAEFDPQQKPDGDLFDHKDVKHLPYRNVWTIVESGEADDDWYASPGFHAVNVLGYVTSEKPWTDDIIEAVFFDASDFEKDEEDEIE